MERCAWLHTVGRDWWQLISRSGTHIHILGQFLIFLTRVRQLGVSGLRHLLHTRAVRRGQTLLVVTWAGTAFPWWFGAFWVVLAARIVYHTVQRRYRVKLSQPAQACNKSEERLYLQISYNLLKTNRISKTHQKYVQFYTGTQPFLLLPCFIYESWNNNISCTVFSVYSVQMYKGGQIQ